MIKTLPQRALAAVEPAARMVVAVAVVIGVSVIIVGGVLALSLVPVVTVGGGAYFFLSYMGSPYAMEIGVILGVLALLFSASRVRSTKASR